MDTKPLGGSGIDIPEIGFGTWQFSGDPSVIHRAVELGSFLLDTAESYNTEQHVGKAIVGHRDEVLVATKISPEHFHRRDVIAACDRSLINLGIDAIDLYQLHAPSSKVPIGETMDAMDRLVVAGKVRYIGVSNFSAEEMADAEAALGQGRVVENQIKYSLFDHEFADGIIPYCEERGISVLAYSSLEHGEFQKEMRGNQDLAEAMSAVCAQVGKTPAQVLLNWTLRSPAVVTIPKTNTMIRVDENCAAAGWRLSDEQWLALTTAAGETKSSYWWR
jgi:diketogulonate reductase-like aldo/keto reductase